MITEDDWTRLEDAPESIAGTTVQSRRVYETGPHDIHIAWDNLRRRRGVWCSFNTHDVSQIPDMPSLRAMTCNVAGVAGSDSIVQLAIYLCESELSHVFTPLVNDIAETIQSHTSSQNALDAAAESLWRWERLLRAAPRDTMSPEEIKGLVGELLVMGELLDVGLSPIDVAQGWTGPFRRNQDFQLPNLAIEVKTTSAKQPQSMLITNERELDSTGSATLSLAHVSLDERTGGNGFSLSDLIPAMITRLRGSTRAVDAFELGLIMLGLSREARSNYLDPRFTVRSLRFYEIRAGFPRIVESMLPSGVGDVKYKIQLSALDSFESAITDLT